ncbi:MAG: L,D-transpeptidase [bacterium]
MLNRSVLPSMLFLAALAASAHAQGTVRRTSDSVRVNGRATPDSAGVVGGRNWFTTLMHKIARRSDDSTSAVAQLESAGADTSAAASIVVATEGTTTARAFKSKKDSLLWDGAKTIAEKSVGYRVVVDLFDRELHVIDGEDTVRTAPVATAMNATLEYGGRVWRFQTPRGVRIVRGKDKDPVWTPPEWHFAEVALEHHLKLATLQRGRTVKLKDGTKLLVEGDEVGIIRPGTKEFVPMVLDEHVVFDSTLFIPPGGTKQRTIEGELGHFRLDLGDGYLLHGTPYAKSIGAAVTHGCVRLRDEDIEWLYENVPVGTKVYIY